tara:strand:- start:2526 stop:3023 length:498 start_codon:yes stop_codon:yes gene_type:complete
MNRHAMMDKLSKMVDNEEINENAYNKLSKKLKKVQDSRILTTTPVLITYEKIKINWHDNGANLQSNVKRSFVLMPNKLYEAFEMYLCPIPTPETIGYVQTPKTKMDFLNFAAERHYNDEVSGMVIALRHAECDYNRAFKYIDCLSNKSDQREIRFLKIADTKYEL